jgi:predicted ABC-type ATPase
MAKTTTKRPLCIVIAGPNGAGKTTFAPEFLLKDTRVIHFVNADVIASGLSPLRPEMVALAAGRIFLTARPSCQSPRGLRVREHVERARLS